MPPVLKIGMKKFFTPNLNALGRAVRAIWGIGLVAAGIFLSGFPGLVRVMLVVFGAFALYEAARGWCIMRACGIKTRM